MNWRRLAWLAILLLITTIVWEVVAIKGMYEKIASAKPEDAHDVSRRLVSLEKRRADHRQRIESLEKLALWPPEADLMSWLSSQANDSDVTIIGVEHPPVEKVSEYQHIPVEITIRGDYNSLGRFINKLEHSPPNKVRIDSFRVRRKEYTPEHVTTELSLSYFQEMERSS